MSDRELIASLEAAKARLIRATAALAPKHKGGEPAEFHAAHHAVMKAERALAAARKEAYDVPLEFPVQWDTGAPLPHLVQNDLQTFLIFLLADTQSAAEGTSVDVVGPRDASSLAIVEFKGCVSAKMGSPNDEVFRGHPLYGKGFEGYRPLQVMNSRWTRELETINSVHQYYDPKHWEELSHFIFGFHDCTFECVARSFVVEQSATSISDALASICRRLEL